MLGSLQKMTTEWAQPINYQLPVGDQLLALTPLLGQKLTLQFSGQIFCQHCQKKTSKSFNQGYCYACFIKLAQCDMCIMKPETCHYAAGTCREPAWGEAFCFQPHYVYLANSSGIKVGITRENQIPTRWMDQGAVQALPIFKVKSRHLSGLIEVVLAQHVNDKTSWQQMLKNNVETLDLIAIRDHLLTECQTDLQKINQQFGAGAVEFLSDAKSLDFHYPVQQYPSKVKSFNFDKQPEVSGILQGIKGQYLILDTGVINIRKFTGYEVSVSLT